ncbi:MAG: phosphoribosylaminoimidazolesuccinocarboxamide synthase [Acidobacteria bacterium]|uniref:Phosphoribosylaminoimidazole-succinocarboxamide synthase n=1 Tax=Candidatus Polarisedimenticola svalbardensis TaxID=2886004 RepID=A0A8J6Y8W4_9BACT|nr:phosphoribosylaminoimidazolesuccinocarboxamide synthase [Candidatus Polarisedimenticola svalbardensis]
MSTVKAIYQTELEGVPLVSRGKVRDIYDLGEHLLIVATDRLSAFDYILPNPIPDKGKVLNQIAEFWFLRSERICLHHVIETDVEHFPEVLKPYADQLRGRSTLAQKLDMLPVECVARGYLAGSGWKEYQESRTVCGIALPDGLKESDKLPEPIFTPATKAEEGHDINIPFEEVERMIGKDRAAEVRDMTLNLYQAGSEYAASRGILIADTKFEFGYDGDQLIIADEMLTPDSSRFWPADKYEPGKGQPSFDKQFVRDYLLSIGWDKQPPVPELPDEIVQGARERYLEIFRILTGRDIV